MREDTYDRWKSADEQEKLWLDLRDCIARYADNVGAFGSDGRFVRHLREFQEHADEEGDIRRACERVGLRELDRDPETSWMVRAFHSGPSAADHYRAIIDEAERLPSEWQAAR